MLTDRSRFHVIPEINPPIIQDDSEIHRALNGRWDEVLITDNPMGIIRVSPYAFAARVTHDVPTLKPIVVTSTRDRNILAVDSEIRGAVMNGVSSFLVVSGDSLPNVDHFSTANEVVRHLKEVQDNVAISFEVGTTCRFSPFSLKKRVDMGAQYFVVGPVMAPHSVYEAHRLLDPTEFSVPIYLGIIPPFNPEWIVRMERRGAFPVASSNFMGMVAVYTSKIEVWQVTRDIINAAQSVGFAGVILMGMKLLTVIESSYHIK